MDATLITIEENDHNANWLVEMQRRRKALDGTPTDLDLARGDALVLAGATTAKAAEPLTPVQRLRASFGLPGSQEDGDR